MATPVRMRGQLVGMRSGGVTYGTGMVQAQVFWNADPLRSVGVKAFVAAGRQARDVAKSAATSRRVARSTSVRFFSGGATTGMDVAGVIRASSPISHWFEEGVKPHMIGPSLGLGVTTAKGGLRTSVSKSRSKKRRGALKFPDGGFSKAPVRHPGMAAKPFLRPAAAAFPQFYNAQLARLLRY